MAMAVKNLSTRVAIIGRGAKCRGGSSAVDKSAYISRTTMYSEYDGTTYYPKYTEDLVHNEVMPKHSWRGHIKSICRMSGVMSLP